MTSEALRLLAALEERLVSGGVARAAADARTAELVSAGLLQSPAQDAWLLTPRGWAVAGALRRYRAEHAELLQVGDRSEVRVDLSAFLEPQDEVECRAEAEVARDVFVRTIANVAGGTDPNLIADRSIAAAQAFRARLRAAGLL